MLERRRVSEPAAGLVLTAPGLCRDQDVAGPKDSGLGTGLTGPEFSAQTWWLSQQQGRGMRKDKARRDMRSHIPGLSALGKLSAHSFPADAPSFP